MPQILRASLVAQLVKNPPAMQETWVRSLGWQNPLEKGIATYPSIPRTSPWGRKEADTTERLSLHFHILKVCELQPGGARALDQPACNSLAVSGRQVGTPRSFSGTATSHTCFWTTPLLLSPMRLTWVSSEMLCGVEGQVVDPCTLLSIILPSLSRHPPPGLPFLPRSASVLSHRPLGFDESSSPSPRGGKLYPERVPQGAAAFQCR